MYSVSDHMHTYSTYNIYSVTDYVCTYVCVHILLYELASGTMYAAGVKVECAPQPDLYTGCNHWKSYNQISA